MYEWTWWYKNNTFTLVCLPKQIDEQNLKYEMGIVHYIFYMIEYVHIKHQEKNNIKCIKICFYAYPHTVKTQHWSMGAWVSEVCHIEQAGFSLTTTRAAAP